MEAKVFKHQMVVEGFKNISIENYDILLNRIQKQVEGCYIQLFNTSLIVGFDHLRFAALNALKAKETRTNISRNLIIDFLVFASGQNQIGKAIDLLGVKPGDSEVVVLIVAEKRVKALKALKIVSDILGGERNNDTFDLTDEKVMKIKKAFKITDLEIEAVLRTTEKEAVRNLIIERVSILTVRT